ncbi:MAG: glycoside hydrolase family 88 protein [Saprospiraceae bacterium]|nr:glycoside hydrolase family 88 protein [Saprospiraceae bacterium]
MQIDDQISVHDLQTSLQKLWQLSGLKILSIESNYSASGAPVFTTGGTYSSRGWTEWTQGFQYGSALLQFDATDDSEFLKIGRTATRDKMSGHVSHFGVHDHGFNNVSTYGNLLRLMYEDKIGYNEWEAAYYQLAIKLSGAVQAKRWTPTPEGGFIYSFNGPHSLFVDTIRTLRILVLAHELGHSLSGENDRKISLLDRAVNHAFSTARYSVFYGENRDQYDTWGRTAHESIFNTVDGAYRCPNAQQGFSGFTTWTRGLAWAMLGFAEQLEYLDTADPGSIDTAHGIDTMKSVFLKAAMATCDFYIGNTASDGIPYWDTGAPQLHQLGDYTTAPADPFNAFEPVDSSAAAIAAQGLLRLGKNLERSDPEAAARYWQAGLTVSKTLLQAPYLSEDDSHQGLLLHSIYHHPNSWDYKPPGSKIANGESSMWGDYHLREVALYLQRIINDAPYLDFFSALVQHHQTQS